MAVEKPMVNAEEPEAPAAEEGHSCPECKRAAENDEIAFAFLLALMPVISLTLFGNMGLL